MQAVQSAHAAIDFILKYPEIASEWHKDSNYLVLVSVESEDKLRKLLDKAQLRDIKTLEFTEPDIGNQLTAIALEPSLQTQKLISNLPLTLKTI